jgi:D-alanine-D-alanine ligase
MDKAVMKVVFAAAGLPVCPYGSCCDMTGRSDRTGMAADLEKALGFPMFVKPANSRIERWHLQGEAPRRARDRDGSRREFDRKIVIEAAVPYAREIECAVLGNDTPEASVPAK